MAISNADLKKMMSLKETVRGTGEILRVIIPHDFYVGLSNAPQDLIVRGNITVTSGSNKVEITDEQVYVEGDIKTTGNLYVTGTINAGGGITFDSDTLTVDDTNNRVGIRTTTPENELTILKEDSNPYIGLFRKDSAIQDGNTLGGIQFGGTSDGVTHPVGAIITANATQDWTYASAEGAQLRFYTNPDDETAQTQRMTIDENGYVGIGDSSPDGMLDISSADSVTDLIIDNTATDGDPRILFQLSGVTKYAVGVEDGDSDKFKITAGTSLSADDDFVMTTAGYVGIGTGSPSRPFHVQAATTTARITNTQTFSSSGKTIIETYQESTSETLAGDDSTDVIESYMTDSSATKAIFSLRGRVNDTNTGYGDLLLRTGQSTSTFNTMMYFDGFYQHVGIGDTSPDYKFDVYDSVDDYVMMIKNGSDPGRGLRIQLGYTKDSAHDNGDDNIFIRFNDTGSNNVGSIRAATQSIGSAQAYSAFVGMNTDKDYEGARVYGENQPVRVGGYRGSGTWSSGVVYVSGGGDFGEWLEFADKEEWDLGLMEGNVVYVKDGKINRYSPGTPMVITCRALLVGNLLDSDDSRDNGAIVSFSGQVPVLTKGPVSDGDYLIPVQEKNYCIAISSDDITFDQYKKAVGVAWESTRNLDCDYNLVLAAIGIK